MKNMKRLLRDGLFFGSRKNIRDSVKYCYADTSVDYLSFLEECRKAEDGGQVNPKLLIQMGVQNLQTH